MSSPTIDDTTLKNLTTIIVVEIMRAYMHPGRAFGTVLQPYT
jgi:hypothetical protein